MAISRYTRPIEQTLEKYIPAPFQEMMQAGQLIQERGDLAQTQQDQVQVGLASIAANPYHQEFVNTFANQFKTKATELLDKYQGNTSNPEFIRESKRLGMQFAADPRLKAVQQAKLEYDKKQAAKQELDAKGVKYIDTNPTYNGLDANGQISGNVGTLRTTNYDKIIADRIQQAARGMEQRGSKISNEWNIAGTNKALKQQLFADPELALGVQHLMQQGNLNEAQAVKVMSDYIDNVSTSMIDSRTDYTLARMDQDERHHQDNLRLQRARLTQEQSAPPPAPFELLSFSKPITPGAVKEENPRSIAITKVKEALANVDDAGNLGTKPSFIESGVAASGYGIPGNITATKAGYKPEEVALLNTARKVLNVKGGSAKNVFTKYLAELEKFENSSNSIKSTDNVKINNAMAEVARRQIASGEVYKVVNGKLGKVSKPEEIAKVANIDDKNISGISGKNLGTLSGYTQFTDKDGSIYYTPIPKEYQRRFAGSKYIENYLEDFDPKNLKSEQVPIKTSDGKIKNMKVLINPNQPALPYVYQGIQGELIPYKSSQNGSLVAGGIFQNQDGFIALPLSEIEDNEFKSLFTNIGNNNKVEGN